MRALKPDFLFSCYYRLMLKRPLLEAPGRGALNLHGSLLPRYRGRCPLNWVLVNGESETGVTLHYMEERPDRGDIVAQNSPGHRPGGHRPDAVCPDDRGRRRPDAGGLPAVAGRRRPQGSPGPEPGLLFGGRGPENGLISWDKEAVAVYNLVRAVTHPYPGAFTHLRKGKKSRKLYVWAGKALAEPADPQAAGASPRRPGLVAAQVPGEGLLVTAGQGNFLITRAQWEGEPEFLGPVLATWDYLVGDVLG